MKAEHVPQAPVEYNTVVTLDQAEAIVLTAYLRNTAAPNDVIRNLYGALYKLGFR